MGWCMGWCMGGTWCSDLGWHVKEDIKKVQLKNFKISSEEEREAEEDAQNDDAETGGRE